MERYNLKISGRVQGVGYRFFTETNARNFGITGWVRNLSDGRVEAEIQGPSEVLEAMLQELNRGPSFGNVTGIVKNSLPVDDSESGFQIRY